MHGRYTDQQIREKADRSLAKALRQPQRKALEEEFAEAHRNDTDEELYEYIKAQKRRSKNGTKRKTTIGYAYLVQRLGPWDDFMRRIVKELSEENARR